MIGYVFRVGQLIEANSFYSRFHLERAFLSSEVSRKLRKVVSEENGRKNLIVNRFDKNCLDCQKPCLDFHVSSFILFTVPDKCNKKSKHSSEESCSSLLVSILSEGLDLSDFTSRPKNIKKDHAELN